MHLSNHYNCWSLRCSWSIACRYCSNYIFILGLTPGFNGLGKVNCKTKRETSKFWNLVSYIRGLTVNTINKIAGCPPKPMIFHLLTLQNQDMVHQKLCPPRHHLPCKRNSYMQNRTHHILKISPKMFWDWCNIRSISTFMYGHCLDKLGVINIIS